MARTGRGFPVVSVRLRNHVAAAGVAPVNTVTPVISTPTGEVVVGAILTTTNGTWTGDATINFTYQWQRDNLGAGSYTSIGGANGSTYLLTDDDLGSDVRCDVTGTNGAGQADGFSNALGVVRAPTPRIVLQGFQVVPPVALIGAGAW